MSDNEIAAPVYRYFTTDLISNDVLMEIPFGGVSYARAIKAAGPFSGEIPVIPSTKHLDLYQTTMPGQTGLYVVRDNVCVWGGLIWGRNYDVKSNILSIDASEFPSYFYHRLIWKTVNYQFGATATVSAGAISVEFQNGSSSALNSGASVKLDFYDPTDFRYNGYYQIANTPTPSTNSFTTTMAAAVTTPVSRERYSNVVTIRTATAHGFSTGDLVTLLTGSPFDGTYTITAPEGSASTYFTFVRAGADLATTPLTGTASRAIPEGVYADVTVSVRSDTYDYLRGLMTAVADDFVGIDFANEYLNPGLSYRLDVVGKQIAARYATLETSGPHGLTVGQAVVVSELGTPYNGEYVVTDVPDISSFRYERGGNDPHSVVTLSTASIRTRSMDNYKARLTTSAAHGLIAGQRVMVDVGSDMDGLAQYYNGEWTILEVPTPTTIVYQVGSPLVASTRTITQPTATVGGQARNVAARSLAGNVATVVTETPSTFTVGNTVVVADLDVSLPIIEKSLDAANSVATITTAAPHQFSAGDTVFIGGLRDFSSVSTKEITGSGASKTVHLTTNPAHNFAAGDTITVTDMVDSYRPNTRSITSNIATLTTSVPHNLATGDVITVNSINDSIQVVSRSISGNVASVTLASAHGFKVNDYVTLSNINETATVVSVEVADGIAILTTAKPHNLLQMKKIVVSGLGGPYDGEHSILSVTDTRVLYEIEDTKANATKHTIPPVRASGNISCADSIFNGTFVVSSVPSTVRLSMAMNAVDSTSRPVTSTGRVTGLSPVNGTFTVLSTPGSGSLTYAATSPNLGTTTVVYPTDAKALKPRIEVASILNGTFTVSAVSRTSVAYVTPVARAVAKIAVSSGSISVSSIFNGSYTLTAASDDQFKYTRAARSNVLENVGTLSAYVRGRSIFNGTHTITAVDATTNTFSYARTHTNVAYALSPGFGTAVVRPAATVSTYGSFPGNTSLGIEFSTQAYSGVDVEPQAYRGHELVSVGKALETYSDNTNGFEYRVDCSYDKDTQRFRRTFVLLPIDFPNPPPPGEASPPSRFGADKLVFEYPGNIIDVKIEESAENSATRFFAVGDADLGADAANPYSVASAIDLLNGENARQWPILDDSESVSDVADETVLYAYAKKYLNESRPPDAKLTVSVNGSLQPTIDTYAPGDWCSLIVDDDFLRMRLASGLEPRDNVIVRKIDSIRVAVPDGVTLPETVELVLVPEWEVDKRG